MGDQKRPLTTSQFARAIDRSESYARKLADTGRVRVQRTATGIRLFDPADAERISRELAAEAAR
jgi:hypothetical protein